MPRPDRHNVNDHLCADTLNAHPAWVMAYDEEDEEGQDEATIKPNDLGDPALPGHVVVDVTFADGSTALGLAGGDFGVESLQELDELRLYVDGIRWAFTLGGDECELDDPAGPFFERYASRLPMRLEPRVSQAFENAVKPYAFTIGADGSVQSS